MTVLGSRTYEDALQLGWPYGDTPTVVVTNRELPSTRKSLEFYSGDLKLQNRRCFAPLWAQSLKPRCKPQPVPRLTESSQPAFPTRFTAAKPRHGPSSTPTLKMAQNGAFWKAKAPNHRSLM